MTTAPAPSITDDLLAEIEADARETMKECYDFNTISPATILALVARVRELERDAARYRWISVDERLPERENGAHYSAWVLTCRPDETPEVAYYHYASGEWVDRDLIAYIEPSHWMPLPEPPCTP